MILLSALLLSESCRSLDLRSTLFSFGCVGFFSECLAYHMALSWEAAKK